MEQAAQDALAAIAAKETWTAEDEKELLKALSGTASPTEKLRAALSEMEAADPDPKGGAALKIGIARYMLCNFAGALEALSEATDNKDRRWYQALCHKNLRQYDKAAEDFERAKDRGHDPAEIQPQFIEMQAMSGKLEEAQKALDRLSGKLEGVAAYAYLRGLVSELAGNGEQAVEAYEKARAIEPRHPGATFRLAYYYDLHGHEDQAVELYKECLSRPPVHANALLNLAVIYEDIGQYDKAMSCLWKLLTVNPNNQRARLFLKDVEAAKTMYFDEEQAKRIARRNAVLDIPVTDFELSVRARNCLKKMNIGTLGDLVRTTEVDLLSYKNFGETSLKEIKDMLSAKGLRLGMTMEDDSSLFAPQPAQAASGPGEGVLATPVHQVEFSVRARRAMETLKIATLGELASKTEAELLACKNFGQTSLNEIKQRLAEFGLSLKEPG